MSRNFLGTIWYKRTYIPYSERNSYIMVKVDALTHYVALKPVPHCIAYYAHTTLYEHWIAKFGIPEILVTDNETEFINNEIITLCHPFNIKHKSILVGSGSCLLLVYLSICPIGRSFSCRRALRNLLFWFYPKTENCECSSREKSKSLKKRLKIKNFQAIELPLC